MANTSSDWIEILKIDLPVAQLSDFVLDLQAGGMAVFLGTTRAEFSSAGAPLAALDYEAYEPMALQQMRDLAKRCRGQWPVLKLALLHRVGRVEVGAPSVAIAVSTPHRAESFAACKWLIDTLKVEVAIWKREVWSDGATSWVHGS